MRIEHSTRPDGDEEVMRSMFWSQRKDQGMKIRFGATLLVLAIAASLSAQEQEKDQPKELEKGAAELLKVLNDGNYKLSIVFTRGKGMKSEIYHWEDGKAARLTRNDEMECYCVLSPDGQKIAFGTTMDKKNYAVRVMDADGSNVKNLTSFRGRNCAPAWSPDGKRIAFQSNRDGNYEIYVMDADGKNQKRLTDKEAYDGYPAWSPDGKRIAYESDNQIHVMDADGKNSAQVTKGPGPHMTRFYWSPDGKKLGFVSGNGPYMWNVYTVDIDGKNTTKVTASSFTHIGFAWSPDSTHIAYCTSNASGMIPPGFVPKNLLQVSDANGKNWKELSKDSNTMSPRWSSDGKWIVFVSTRNEICIASHDGKTQGRLTKMDVGYGANSVAFVPACVFQEIPAKAGK